MGHTSVRRFFEGIVDRLEITTFDTTEFVVQGDTVAYLYESGALRSTGAAFRNESVQKYVVRENQITQMAESNIQVDPRKLSRAPQARRSSHRPSQIHER